MRLASTDSVWRYRQPHPRVSLRIRRQPFRQRSRYRVSCPAQRPSRPAQSLVQTRAGRNSNLLTVSCLPISRRVPVRATVECLHKVARGLAESARTRETGRTSNQRGRGSARSGIQRDRPRGLPSKQEETSVLPSVENPSWSVTPFPRSGAAALQSDLVGDQSSETSQIADRSANHAKPQNSTSATVKRMTASNVDFDAASL